MSEDYGNNVKIGSLIADFPEGFPLSPGKKGIYQSYSGTFGKLFLFAKKTVRICNPFIDEYGAKYLIKHLNANNNKPKIQLVVRNINKKELMILKKEEIHIFILNEEHNKWGFHAKYAIFDDNIGLIGSQNLTKRSILRNLEMGIIVDQETAKKLLSIHKLLIANSNRSY